MRLAFSSFSTSSITALLRSGANNLRFYCTGLYSRLTLKRCYMIFLTILGISLCFQAKTSWFALKKEIIFSFLRAGSAVLILISSTSLLGRSPLLLVFLMVQKWALVRWSPMCDSLQMLRQLDGTILPKLGLLWFLLHHGLLETSLSSNMLMLLLLVCWVQVFPRWCFMLKDNQL